MANKASFTAAEWQLIKDSPYWIQTAITTAEGKMGFVEKRKEGAALQDYLANQKASDELVKEVLVHQDRTHEVDMEASHEDVLKTLSRIEALVEKKATRAEVDAFNEFLLGAGNAIAAAHVEKARRRGDKDVSYLSDAEEEALEAIAKALGADEASKADRAQAEAAKRRAAAEKRREEANKRRREAAAAAAAEAEAKRKAAEEAEKKAQAAEEARLKAEEAAKRRKEAAEKRRKEAEARKQRIAEAKRKREEEARKQAEAAAKQAEEDAAAKAAAEAEQSEEAKAAAASREKKAALGNNGRYHTVSAGENLSKISEKYYGHQGNWSLIYEANRDLLTNPNIILPGQRLLIP